MGIRFERDAAHLLQQGRKTRIVFQMGAQGQGVEEKANQRFDLTGVTIDDGRAHHDIVLTAIAAHQHGKHAVQRHKQARTGLLAEGTELVDKLCVKLKVLDPAVKRLGQRPGMVRGQNQQGWRICKLLPPIS